MCAYSPQQTYSFGRIVLNPAYLQEYTNDLVLVRNGDEARVFASLIGTVKYANGGIHGFAYA